LSRKRHTSVVWLEPKGLRKGWGNGRRNTAVDDSRKETADRAARYHTD
jgi:hypothetical protein